MILDRPRPDLKHYSGILGTTCLVVLFALLGLNAAQGLSPNPFRLLSQLYGEQRDSADIARNFTDEEAVIPKPPRDAVAVFLHGLKTGGTTLSDLLLSLHGDNAVVPGSARSDLFNASLLPIEQSPSWTVLYAHEGWRFLETLPFPAAPLALVRRPDHWVESMMHSDVFGNVKKRFPDTLELVEALADYQSWILSSRGTAYAGPRGRPRGVPLGRVRREALMNARQCAWIGVTERFSESICLLCYSFGWPLPATWKNQRERGNRTFLPTELTVAVNTSYAGDWELWNLANRLLDKRLATMRHELFRTTDGDMVERYGPCL